MCHDQLTNGLTAGRGIMIIEKFTHTRTNNGKQPPVLVNLIISVWGRLGAIILGS